MAGIQPLPGGGNPWAQALPGFVQQLAMMKVRQNFIAKEAEMKREYDKVKLEEERVYQEGILKQKQEFTGSENQKNRSTQLVTSPQLRPIKQENLPAGTPGTYDPVTDTFFTRKPEVPKDPRKPTTLRGKQFYWEHRDGKWYQTSVPAPEPDGGIQIGSMGMPPEPGKNLPGGSLKNAAKEGTGVWANIGSAIDAVAGGLGIDALLGKDGFFKDTQDARQQLRLVKQVGKSALMNSSRGAIWEQQKIDKLFPDPNVFFTNPRTEARKLKTLRYTLKTELKHNYDAMRITKDKVRLRTLQESSAGIEKLLSHIGEEDSGDSFGLEPADNALIEKYLKTP